MGKYGDIKEEIKKLVDKGAKLYEAIDTNSDGKSKDLGYFISNYEQWYSKALIIVKQFAPDRLNDFVLFYKNDRRKNIDVSTYTVLDALRLVHSSLNNFGPSTARFPFFSQLNIVISCLNSFDSKICNIQTILQADIFDSEIDSAKHLMKNGFLRAAGAICGVVLEKHFSTICSNRDIYIKKKNPTIADFNDALKDVAYDTIEWRGIQRLADLRNLCDHNKDREPTKDEIDELISGTEKVTKTIF